MILQSSGHTRRGDGDKHKAHCFASRAVVAGRVAVVRGVGVSLAGKLADDDFHG